MSKVNWLVINIGFHGKVLVCSGLRPILGLEKMHLVLTIEWRKAASAFWCALTCCTFTEESDAFVSLLGWRLLSLLREEFLWKPRSSRMLVKSPKWGR